MNQLFSPELIPDYMHAHPEYGVKRILTYTVYRFLSFAGKEDDTLAAYIKETLFPMEDALDFSRRIHPCQQFYGFGVIGLSPAANGFQIKRRRLTVFNGGPPCPWPLSTPFPIR